MAVRLQIDLPRRLYSKATRRASENGHSTLAGYITSLIQTDVTEERASKVGPLAWPKGRTEQVTVSRESFRVIRKRLLDGMMTHMKTSEDPGYGYTCGHRLKHIDRCAAIIDAFHTRLFTKPRPTPDRVLDAVKGTVLKLNKLNGACGRALIETDQREDLCELILGAARNAGLKVAEDITERWRQW